MNFLAHFLLSVHENSSEFHLGSILPDIARRAGIRIDSKAFDSADFPRHSPLEKGVLHHWKSDAIFHNHPLFHRACSIWKEELGPLIPAVSRRFFLFHLLAEIWLDRILMIQNKGAAEWLYASTSQVDHSLLNEFAKRMGDHQEKMLTTFEEFQTRRFIIDYINPQYFASIASGVFAHGSRQANNPLLRQKIAGILPELDLYQAEMLKAWEQFSSELHSSEKNEPEI